jgi:hypothetical protein
MKYMYGSTGGIEVFKAKPFPVQFVHHKWTGLGSNLGPRDEKSIPVTFHVLCELKFVLKRRI